jgi:hypothetical protein
LIVLLSVDGLLIPHAPALPCVANRPNREAADIVLPQPTMTALKMRFEVMKGKHIFNKWLTAAAVVPDAIPGRAGRRTKKEPRKSGSQEFNREASNEVAPATR